MSRSILHPHTGLPIHPLGYRNDGRPIWPILGASEDDDAAADQGDDNADEDDGDGAVDESGDEGTADLGDKGKQALDRMKDRLKAERAKVRAAQAELAEQKKAAVGEAAKSDLDEARAEAVREVQVKANARILRSEIKAAAGGKLTDPSDAIRLLDLEEFEVDDDGNVDEDAITEAIADLIKNKPYLAAQGGKRFEGGADGGARKEPKQSIDDQIREAESKGDWKTSMALKARKSLDAQSATA